MKNKLHLSLNKTGGRNNLGKTTIYTKSGGAKIKYRFIDFRRIINFKNITNKVKIKQNITFFIKRIEKDPNRSALIALICYLNGSLSYIIATEKMKIGDKLSNYNNVSFLNSTISKNTLFDIKNGNSFKLKNLPAGSLLNNIELYPNAGSKINRAAGVWSQLIKKHDDNYFQVKLKSGEHRLIHKNCTAVIGVVSNIYNNQMQLYKAGQSRLLGRKPSVRGRAMNPVDHPHGGRTNGGIAPRTPWGKLTKNFPTRSNKKVNFIIINRKLNK